MCTTAHRHDIRHGRNELKANSGNAETLETPLLRHWSIGRSCYVATRCYCWPVSYRPATAPRSYVAGTTYRPVNAVNLPSLRSDLRRWPPLQQVSLFLSLFLSLARWTRNRLADGDLISSLLSWEICEHSADFSPDFSCEFFFKSFHMRFWHEKQVSSQVRSHLKNHQRFSSREY